MVLMKTVEALRKQGYSVGGMLSREVRKDGFRVGFEIEDLLTGRRGWLAQINQHKGPSVGKYHVNIEDLNSVGVQAIAEAIEHSDVVAIDEVGPMELFSEKFKEAAEKALEYGKLVLAVVHQKARDKFVVEAKNSSEAEVVVVTLENRGRLPETLALKAIAFLEQCG
jgi:nucleoside-triphosphatase